ncbi:glycosyltransferase family 2 protein [Priestia abyssalis]|uniref:glycosyltransferase family 2 protein n=1 Tax=Priestia abyssalis TaxID=1221450 RepID=UPI00099581CE|nr:glycosyltransferase family 2 protein [Priestia abyssalis]
MKKHLILIPAYNEEGNLKKVLQSLTDVRPDADILIVSDGSTDETENIAKAFPVYVISHPTNLGYAAALQTGFKYAAAKGYDIVIQFDGDGQHDPHYVGDMLHAFSDKGADIVLGSRFLRKSGMETGVSKRLVIFFFRFLIWLITGAKITDPTSGFRGYKHNVYRRFTHAFPNEYPDSNFIIELLLREYNLVEIPVNMKNREHGISMHAGFRPVLYVAQVVLSIIIVWLRCKWLKKEGAE